MENQKETLADIVRQKTPASRGRRRSRISTDFSKTQPVDLGEEKNKVVEQLFENAKNNITRLEEYKIFRERAHSKPNPQEVITPKVKIIDGKVVIDRDSMINACAQSKINLNELVKVQESGVRSRAGKKKHNERWNEEETQLFYTVSAN